MFAHISKWGNSLGVRIPQPIASQLKITEGSSVEIIVEDEQLIIRKQPYKLQDLLKQVNQKNLHKEIDFGAPEGKETWE